MPEKDIIIPPSSPATPPPAPNPHHGEESGSQALAEALRSSFGLVKVIMIILVLCFLGSGIFTVPSQQKALLLRFGKPVGGDAQRFLGPGLHWSFPRPIDEVISIPIGEIQTITSTTGWYATTPEAEASGEEAPPNASLNPAADGYAITADANIYHVRATLRYHISNPVNYALNFVNASNVVQNALNNSILYATARFTADQLRTEQLAFQDKILNRVKELVDQQSFGIKVEQVDVRAIPPRQVKADFDRALAADVERRKAIDEAHSYANRILSTAQGESNSIVNIARTEMTRTVESISGDARYFQEQLPYFKANPNLFMARLQTLSLQRVLTNSEDKIFVPARRDGKSRELRIQLSREQEKPVTLQTLP